MDTHVNITGYSARITKADGGYITGKVIGITGRDGQEVILLDSGERVSTRKALLVSVEGGLILVGPGAALADFREIGQTELEDILEGYRDRGPLFPASVYVSLMGLVPNLVEDDTSTETPDDTPTEIPDPSLPEPQNIINLGEHSLSPPIARRARLRRAGGKVSAGEDEGVQSSQEV
jgi:hypothetical protein